MERIRTIIEKPIPSVNNMVDTNRNNIMYETKQFKEYKEYTKKELYKIYKDQKPITDRIIIIIKLYFPNFIGRDIDNYNKVILDCLKDLVIADDEIIDVLINLKFKNYGTFKTEIIIDDDLDTIFKLSKYIKKSEMEYIKNENKYNSKTAKKKNIVVKEQQKKSIGLKLKTLRSLQKLSIKKVSTLTGISVDKLTEYELNLKKIGKRDLIKICQFYNIDEMLLLEK